MDSTTTEKHKSRHCADSDDDHKSKKRRKDKEHKKDDEREHRKDRDRKDKDREHKKDRGREHKKDKHRKHKSKSKDQGISVVDDDGEEDMWVEKNIDGEGSAAVVSGIPTAESLGLNSNPSYVPDGAKEPPSNAQTTQTKLQRDEWMLLDPSTPTVPIGTPSRPPDRAVLQTADEMTDGFGEEVRNMRTLGGGVDFFSSLGTEHRKKPPPKDPNEKPKISAREMNRGEPEPESTTNKGPPAPGAPGSQWRMLKLKRTYQEAEEDGRPLEDVVRDRWDSWEHWEAALAERKWMDERAPSQSQSQRSGPPQRGGGGGGERYMFNTPPADLSRSSSRNSFRKPGESTPTTPGAGPGTGANATQAFKGRVDALKGAPKPTLGEAKSGLQSAGPSTPIPTVLAPNLPPQGKKKRGLSPSELNKLQAKVLRAKLMGGEDADRLQAEYDEAVRVANGGDGSDGDEEETRVEAVPTMDGHGRLYDIGTGKGDQGPPVLPGNRRKNQDNFETRDPKTGELLRINADDDTQTLADLLREERLGGGPSDQKNLDAALAGAIARDGKYEDDLEYVDDNAERLARRKMKSDAMKRQFAIQDYARTQKVLSSCVYCPGNDKDEMAPPRAGVIAMGTRVYLAVTPNEELVPGHCQIVPLQHMLSMLEGDDDVWDEVKNFMKCLMRTFAEEDKGVVFYETVMSLRQQRHTVIECVPVPREQFTELPAYFRESILMSESEWSQHKKLIDFSKRPGGFRRSMVPNLPYFMVQWDYKGEQGYGHVIEGRDMADDPDGDVDEGDKGGGQFPRWFAAEIIGNILDVEPRRWRRPRKEDFRMNDRRVEVFKKKFDKYDWTKMLAQSS